MYPKFSSDQEKLLFDGGSVWYCNIRFMQFLSRLKYVIYYWFALDIMSNQAIHSYIKDNHSD